VPRPNLFGRVRRTTLRNRNYMVCPTLRLRSGQALGCGWVAHLAGYKTDSYAAGRVALLLQKSIGELPHSPGLFALTLAGAEVISHLYKCETPLPGSSNAARRCLQRLADYRARGTYGEFHDGHLSQEGVLDHDCILVQVWDHPVRVAWCTFPILSFPNKETKQEGKRAEANSRSPKEPEDVTIFYK